MQEAEKGTLAAGAARPMLGAFMPMHPSTLALIRAAIAEDVGPGDVTSEYFIPADSRSKAEIVAREVGIEPAVAKRLVGLARKVRSLSELGLAETVSTRLLVNAARLIRAGVDPRVACVHTVVAPLTDDPEVAGALRDIVHLVF